MVKHNKMKKEDCEKLSEMTWKDFENLNDAQADVMLKKVLPEKARFKCAGMGDKDWWYAVKYFDVEEKNRLVYMCVIRSWNKYKQRWIYKAIESFSLLYCLHLDNEYIG